MKRLTISGASIEQGDLPTVAALKRVKETASGIAHELLKVRPADRELGAMRIIPHLFCRRWEVTEKELELWELAQGFQEAGRLLRAELDSAPDNEMKAILESEYRKFCEAAEECDPLPQKAAEIIEKTIGKGRGSAEMFRAIPISSFLVHAEEILQKTIDGAYRLVSQIPRDWLAVKLVLTTRFENDAMEPELDLQATLDLLKGVMKEAHLLSRELALAPSPARPVPNPPLPKTKAGVQPKKKRPDGAYRPNEVCWNGKSYHTSLRSWKLLDYLLKQDGPVQFDVLFQNVWDNKYIHGDSVEDHTITGAVSRLGIWLSDKDAPWRVSTKAKHVILESSRDKKSRKNPDVP